MAFRKGHAAFVEMIMQYFRLIFKKPLTKLKSFLKFNEFSAQSVATMLARKCT